MEDCCDGDPRLETKDPVPKGVGRSAKAGAGLFGAQAGEKESALDRLLEERVPEKVQRALDAAFEKAFLLIFEKGAGVIERTYRKDALRDEYKVNLYAHGIRRDRRSLRAFSRGARKAGRKNLVISGAAGVGMGLLGIGLPDVAVFTGMVLRCVYEIALRYGFEYESEREKYFILLLIEGAVSHGDQLTGIDRRLEAYSLAPGLPEGYSFREQVAKTSGMLSKELLYMKFLQGVPIVGAVGGAYDFAYMRNISEYAGIKYQKRFLQGYNFQG